MQLKVKLRLVELSKTWGIVQGKMTARLPGPIVLFRPDMQWHARTKPVTRSYSQTEKPRIGSSCGDSMAVMELSTVCGGHLMQVGLVGTRALLSTPVES